MATTASRVDFLERMKIEVEIAPSYSMQKEVSPMPEAWLSKKYMASFNNEGSIEIAYGRTPKEALSNLIIKMK